MIRLLDQPDHRVVNVVVPVLGVDATTFAFAHAGGFESHHVARGAAQQLHLATAPLRIGCRHRWQRQARAAVGAVPAQHEVARQIADRRALDPQVHILPRHARLPRRGNLNATSRILQSARIQVGMGIFRDGVVKRFRSGVNDVGAVQIRNRQIVFRVNRQQVRQAAVV